MVMFRWIPEATREQKERVKDELKRLPALIPQVRSYDIGEDLGLAGEINFDFAVVADFDDLGGFVAYRDNPEHRAIVETYIQPIAGARGAVQYEI
jgi:Stress responsive A/B Barrel Domain